MFFKIKTLMIYLVVETFIKTNKGFLDFTLAFSTQVLMIELFPTFVFWNYLFVTSNLLRIIVFIHIYFHLKVIVNAVHVEPFRDLF